MHLLRIEAVRYGELAGVVLGDLGPGLNVVLGPNESGKSTFTSLVRHILYGFPRGRPSERLYQPPSGDQRVGRLVFAADGGAVTVERVEGVRGGTAVLSGPHGEEPADALLEELTRGVSPAVFAAVFGFSLEELSNLRSLDDIQARLVTSTSGLALDPHDAIAELRGRAEELWAPRARARVLRDLAGELRELKEQRRQLEAAAERFRDDREERERVSAELGESETALAAARGAADRMAALLGEARRLSGAARTEDEAAVEERLRAEALRRDGAAVAVDERLLARAEALERLAARGELFRAEAEQLRRDDGRLRELDLDLERRLGDLGAGWTLEAALALRLDLDLETRLAAAEELLQAARRHQEESARRAAEAAAEHRAALDEARTRAAGEGAGGDDQAAAESARLRLQAVDRLLALGARGGAGRSGRWPALAAAVVAAVLATAGIGLGDRWLLIGAALPALLAAALALAGWWQGRRGPAEIAPLLAILGREVAPSPAELIALRSALEEQRRAWAEAAQLGRAAAARRQAAEDAAAAAASAWSDWVG
ncbi:MAG: AAA family ATPase, partial [Thermoanaerobaculales bacterium]|nr:AAA family ATPase [Thermoanaerobaculales bacterium]